MKNIIINLATVIGVFSTCIILYALLPIWVYRIILVVGIITFVVWETTPRHTYWYYCYLNEKGDIKQYVTRSKSACFPYIEVSDALRKTEETFVIINTIKISKNDFNQIDYENGTNRTEGGYSK